MDRYRENDCVVLNIPLEGSDNYFDQYVRAPKGTLATIVNVFGAGAYEIEFMDKNSKTGWGIFYASEADLAPYVKNAP